MGDLGSIHGFGRSPGEGKAYPLQYSGLENSIDCIIHGVTKSWTQLSDFDFQFSTGEVWKSFTQQVKVTDELLRALDTLKLMAFAFSLKKKKSSRQKQRKDFLLLFLLVLEMYISTLLAKTMFLHQLLICLCANVHSGSK